MLPPFIDGPRGNILPFVSEPGAINFRIDEYGPDRQTIEDLYVVIDIFSNCWLDVEGGRSL